MRDKRLKALFLITAVVEDVTELSALALPTIVLTALLGIQPATVEMLFVGRIAGAALLTTGVAGFLARIDATLPAQRELLTGVLRMAGLALWPAVVLHTLLGIWCVLGLQTELRR
jgi:hypothetical protein